jgi:hypothetical protein
MENMNQSMALEDVGVDLDDDTLTVIPKPETVESGNIVSPTVGRAGDRAGAGAEAGPGNGAGAGPRAGDGNSEKGQFQRKERQKTSKVWNNFVSVKIVGVQKSQCNWCKKIVCY